MGIRNAAESVETPPGRRPLWLVRTGDAPVALAVSGDLPGALAAHRCADSLDDRHCRSCLSARPARSGLAAIAAGDGVALSRRLHVRVLLRRRADRIVRRLPTRSGRPSRAGVALLAAFPLPAADVRRAPQVSEDGPLR